MTLEESLKEADRKPKRLMLISTIINSLYLPLPGRSLMEVIHDTARGQ
jgi:hypothetical protein